MKLIDGDREHSFSSSSYEDENLGPLNYTVEVLNNSDEIFDAFQGTDSCIENEELADQKAYADTFADSDNVHFYSVGDQVMRELWNFQRRRGMLWRLMPSKPGKNLTLKFTVPV